MRSTRTTTLSTWSGDRLSEGPRWRSGTLVTTTATTTGTLTTAATGVGMEEGTVLALMGQAMEVGMDLGTVVEGVTMVVVAMEGVGGGIKKRIIGG